MAFPVLGLHRKSQDIIPLLMERPETRNDNEHVIDITNNSDASSSSNSSHERRSSILDQQRGQDPQPNSSRGPNYQPPVFSGGGSSNTRSSSVIRRANSRNRQRSPINSVLWISVELLLTVGQIIAAIIVLSSSKHEKPRAPLRAWVVGYASGCVSILPLLYWRFRYRNLGTEQDPSQHRQDSSFGNNSSGHLTRRTVEEEDGRTSSATTRVSQSNRPHPRLKAFAEYLKMALDCFFAVWFVVGNVWIFGGHSPADGAPQLYRLCIIFLTFSCIGYAMPFILCATICCCLPCIISVLGFREDLSQNRGATQDSINSLPTYKFKTKKNKTKSDKESASSSGEGGVIASGTEKERAISGEDAVCCICLAKYANNDELKELPCSHFFHKDCVDKWLKINATCPLCKAEVGETLFGSLTETTANLRNGTML